MVPLAGSTMALVTVSGSPSGSESLTSTLMVTGWSSGVMALSGVATGAVLRPEMVMRSSALALAPLPSETV